MGEVVVLVVGVVTAAVGDVRVGVVVTGKPGSITTAGGRETLLSTNVRVLCGAAVQAPPGVLTKEISVEGLLPPNMDARGAARFTW